MSAHTPGPWTVEDGEIFKEGACLARVYDWDDFPCLEDDEEAAVNAEARANARLIASAPDLLAALREIDGLMGDVTRDPMQKLVVIDALVSVAIAKATGAELQP